jgi:hypothetical protein
MPVRQSCNESELHGRCVIHKYARTKSVKCTTDILEAHLPRMTCMPHARSKTDSFHTVGERRARGLYEPLAQ